jgi:serine/threonine protein kinase
MPSDVPTHQVFEAHGLQDVQVEHVGEWISGWATFSPTDRPFFCPTSEIPHQVRFSWCSNKDPGSAHRFRRRAQIILLDSLSSPVTTSRPSTPSENSASSSSFRRNRHGLRRKILAWWEDADGLWFIKDEVKLAMVGLMEWWSNRVSHRPTLPDDEVDMFSEIPKVDRIATRDAEDDPLDAYAEGCEVLLGMVRCLESLHEKNLINVSARTSSFAVDVQNPLGVELVAHLDAVTLPGFSLDALLTDTDYADTTLFCRDPLDPPFSNLSVEFISRNLRFLAPEAVSGRRVSPTSDIYSFGVCAYELVTGTTVDGGPDTPGIQDIDWLIDIQHHLLINIIPPSICLKREAEFGNDQLRLPPQQLSDIIMKCLAKDTDDRYGSREALMYDLNTLGKICRAKGDLSKFRIGEVDKASRFSLPSQVIHRDQELEELDRGLDYVRKLVETDGQIGVPTKAINLWGYSGSGKSQIMSEWAAKNEKRTDDQGFLVGYAKLDEHVRNPLSSFSQVFESLCERVFTDPKEDREHWKRMIDLAVGTKLDLFLPLLNPTTRKLLSISESKATDDVDVSLSFLPKLTDSGQISFLHSNR